MKNYVKASRLGASAAILGAFVSLAANAAGGSALDANTQAASEEGVVAQSTCKTNEVAFTGGVTVVSENDGVAHVSMVRRSTSCGRNPVYGPISIYVHTGDLTAIDGTNYASTGCTLTWDDSERNQVTKTCDIPIYNDGVHTPTLRFLVGTELPRSNGKLVKLGEPDVTRVSIENVDNLENVP